MHKYKNFSKRYTMASTTAASSGLFSVVGKRVLVTGGSRGIGLMIAKGFVNGGAEVLITSRDEGACAKASQQHLGGCAFVASNLSSREGCEQLINHAKQVFGGSLDVLINNAGASWGEDPYTDREPSKRSNWGWDKVLDLNVKGIFYLSRKCVPLLERNSPTDDPGRIINVGSVAGLVPQVSFSTLMFMTHSVSVLLSFSHRKPPHTLTMSAKLLYTI